GNQGQQTSTPSSSFDNATIGSSTPTSQPDDTSTYLLIGGIITAGVIGIIIVKKTRSKTTLKPKDT
ncbi:MAG: hypothetical protein KGH85_06210, partial [Thaumarchaeota archaeon]|nr:hypothetical protein [Nitrososphaerota archaeon]